MTEGQRNPNYVQDHIGRIRNHVEDIKSGTVQEYRLHRMTAV